MKITPWTFDRMTLLRQRWAEGVSGSLIAKELGPHFTRMAVLGKVHRMGLSSKSTDRITESLSSAMLKIKWTDERIETLRTLWISGIAATEIARALGGIGRDAVTSKALRIGLGKRGRFVTLLPRRRPTFTKRDLATEAFPSLDIGFLNLERHHCREVTGRGDDGLAIFCGHQKAEASSFCPHHHAINYSAPQKSPEERAQQRSQMLRRAA